MGTASPKPPVRSRDISLQICAPSIGNVAGLFNENATEMRDRQSIRRRWALGREAAVRRRMQDIRVPWINMLMYPTPASWTDLQNTIARILREIGFSTSSPKRLRLARGSVEVDVFGVDTTTEPNIVNICEAKHWKKNVPKTIVHAFRSVVSDYGANVGFIISKKGFQRSS